MTTFEEKVNAYRENKRLMEELGACLLYTSRCV